MTPARLPALARRWLGRWLRRAPHRGQALRGVGWPRRRRSPAAARPYSLRRRLVFATVGSTAACWLVSLALIVGVAWRETSDVFDDTLEEGARLVAALSASMRERGELDGGEGGGLMREGRRVRLYYQVVAENGEMLRRSRNVPDQPFVAHADGDRDFYNTWLDGRAWRVHVLHVPGQDFFVQVAQPWDARTELLEEMAEGLVWPALLLLLLLGAVNWLAIRRLLRPLERMAHDIARKSPDDLGAVPSGGQADELRPMVDALNGVLARLDDALRSERRFTADAAHELRTPLAALRMKIQLMQRRRAAAGSAADPDGASLQALRDDVDRCTALVENLLALARLDPQQPGTLALAPLDARALVDAALGDGAALWRSRQLRIETDVRVDGIRGHRELLRSALRNLLDNAARYGRPGGRVRIEVAAMAAPGPPGDRAEQAAGSAGRWVRIAVRDDGPGVPPEERARLAQRFYRALGSGQPGSGLGLSIVERIAALHGGRLLIEDGLDGRGLSVVVAWPA